MLTTQTCAMLILAAAALSWNASGCPQPGSAPDQQVALCLHEDALAAYSAADFKRAEVDYLRAIPLWKKAGPDFDAHRAASMLQLGVLYQGEGRWDESISNLTSALSLHRSALGEHHERTAANMVRLATSNLGAGRLEDANKWFALASASNSGASDFDRVLAWNAFGVYYGLKGDMEQGLEYLRRAERTMAAINDKDPAYGAVLCNIAAIYVVSGDTARAAPMLRRVRAIFAPQLPPEHYRMATLMLQEGTLALVEGRIEEAKATLSEARRIAALNLPANSNELVTYEAALGLAYYRDGDYAKADPLLTHLVAVRRANYSEPHRELALAIQRLASLRARQHKDAEAARLFNEALAVYQKAVPADSPDYREALMDYAQFAHSIRDGKLARSLEKRAKQQGQSFRSGS